MPINFICLLILLPTFCLQIKAAKMLGFNKKTNPAFLIANRNQRPLFENEFVTESTCNPKKKNKQWSVKICNPSFFSKRSKKTVNFSGKLDSFQINKKYQNTSPYEEYYHLMIEEISPNNYSITYPSNWTFFKNWNIARSFGLDDIIPLRNKTFSTIRTFLHKKYPSPLLTFDSPLINIASTLFHILGKIEIFSQQNSDLPNNIFLKNKYFVKYTDNNQKEHCNILEPRESIVVNAYNKCRSKINIQTIRIPLKTLLNKSVFHILQQQYLEELITLTKNNCSIQRPGLILLKSQDGKSFGIVYQPIRKLNLDKTPNFSKDIIFNILPIDGKVKIQVINTLGNLEKIELSFRDLL